MKKLIPLFIALASGIASAEWKLNPYTQRQDYYESKAGVAASTGTLTIGLAAEIARASAAEAAIAVDTGTLTTGLATEISNRQIADAAIAVSTGANAAAISALDAAKVNRAGDTMTGQLNVSSNVVATSSITANFVQGGGANFPLPVTGISLSEVEDLEANKTFTMANKTLEWQFTNPSGGMLWEFTGAAGGHSLEIAQSGGNPGADMHLLHLHAEDADPTTLHLVPGSTASRAILVHAEGDTVTNPGRFELNGNGDMAWGTGGGATDTTLERTGVAALQTNAALTATSFIGPLTGNSATATKLATARTINGVSFDGSANININISTTSYLADGVSLALTGATFSADASSVTLQGNTFNGASQLVKLDALSKLPAVDGSQLTNLPSASGGAVLSATQTFTGGNTFTGSVAVSSFTATGSASFISTTSTVTFGGGVQIGTFSVTGSGTSNGWTTLPNGLIMEWIYDNTGTGGTNTRTLPKAFPTSGLSCFCTYAGAPLANSSMGCAFNGKTQYVYYNYQGPALYCMFIGY